MRAWAVVACIIAGLCAVIFWQRGSMRDQTGRMAKIEVERDSLSQSVERLRALQEADKMVVVQSAEQAERMASRAKMAEYRLQEALHAEVDADRVLSRGITDALCLRYGAASGANGGDPDCSAGCADAGKSHTAAAGSTVPANCNAWAGLRVRDVLEWSGLLLDHAGLERIDKAAIRGWVRRTQNSGAAEVSR